MMGSDGSSLRRRVGAIAVAMVLGAEGEFPAVELGGAEEPDGAAGGEDAGLLGDRRKTMEPDDVEVEVVVARTT